MGFAVLGFSFPVFVIGYVLIYFFALQLELLPVQGYVRSPRASGRSCQHDPARARARLGFMALIARMTRASMLEVLSQDYIRTAHAKGFPTRRCCSAHALKNAAVPDRHDRSASASRCCIGGVVVTESVFAIPGVGRLTVDAILRRDYPVIQGVMLVFSAAYVVVNLAIDLSYTCSIRASATDEPMRRRRDRRAVAPWRAAHAAAPSDGVIGGVCCADRRRVVRAVARPSTRGDRPAQAPAAAVRRYWFGTDGSAATSTAA